MLFITLLLALTLVALIYIFMIWNYDYWSKRGVDGPRPVAVFGNFPDLITQKRHIVYDTDDIYREYKQRADFVGIFSGRTPHLLITSPELAHRIYVTDFKYFHDNALSSWVDEKSDFLFANNLFSLTGDKWRERRADISPGMSSSRIQSVYPVAKRICQRMKDYIGNQARLSPKDGIDTKDVRLQILLTASTYFFKKE